jgi:hypothetical protein
MGQSQKKAVRRYRERQKENGNVRVEVNVPKHDSPLIRDVAANLRAGGALAERTRSVLKSLLSPFAGMSLKELIENAPPLDDLDLERSKELPGDIDL